MLKSIKVSVLTVHGDFRGVVLATSKNAAIKGILVAMGSPSYRLIDRKGYSRAVSTVGSLDPAWFNVEAS